MARERGTFNFSASLEVKKQAPLDARQTYITYAELTQQSTWVDADSKVWLFKGLVVPVDYNGKHALFMLINPDNYTSTSSWVRVDAAGVESSIFKIGNINTLNTASTGEDVAEVLGAYADFLKAYNSNKIILADFGGYKSVASVKFYMEDDSNGYFEISVTEWGSGYPIVRFKKIKIFEFNWDNVNPIEEDVSRKVALAEDLNILNNIYFLGDVTTVSENGPSSDMNTVLTSFADFKKAFNEKKIFIAKTTYGQVYVQVQALAENVAYLFTYVINENGDVCSRTFVAQVVNNNWDSYGSVEKNKLATQFDLTKKVSSINPAPEKGIEIGGTAQYPTVGIKLDPTQGNVTLSLGENGLKANDATALRDVTGQNFIKKNGTNVEGHLNLTYNNATKKINLEGFDSSVIASIDATAFIKDGMIDTVELVTNPESHDPGTYLVITFNTDAGKEDIYLDVSSLIDAYTGGNGITVSGNSISVKIDESTEKYISTSTNGLKISGINAKIEEVVEQAIIEALAWHEA